MITYGSVCSGIEAATTAWHPLGWSPRWFAEIEPFPSAVLAHHWPDVPNLGDFTAIRDKIAAGAVEAPDVLVGGTPCQAFSVAGLRQSLDDKRGQLAIEFVRLADAIDSARSLGGKPADECPDGPRYKALGNSMAVPVMRWIGARLDAALRERQS